MSLWTLGVSMRSPRATKWVSPLRPLPVSFTLDPSHAFEKSKSKKNTHIESLRGSSHLFSQFHMYVIELSSTIPTVQFVCKVRPQSLTISVWNFAVSASAISKVTPNVRFAHLRTKPRSILFLTFVRFWIKKNEENETFKARFHTIGDQVLRGVWSVGKGKTGSVKYPILRTWKKVGMSL